MEACGNMALSVTEQGHHWHTQESIVGWGGQAAPSKAIGLLWLPHLSNRNTGKSCPSPEACGLHGLPAKEQELPSLAFLPAAQ